MKRQPFQVVSFQSVVLTISQRGRRIGRIRLAVENAILYAYVAVGVAVRGEYYFSKHARDLTLTEAALLAGLPRGRLPTPRC